MSYAPKKFMERWAAKVKGSSSAKSIKRYYDGLLSLILDELQSNREIYLPYLGKLYLKEYGGYELNFNTDENVYVPIQDKVKFKVAKSFKDSVNGWRLIEVADSTPSYGEDFLAPTMDLTTDEAIIEEIARIGDRKGYDKHKIHANDWKKVTRVVDSEEVLYNQEVDEETEDSEEEDCDILTNEEETILEGEETDGEEE